MIKSRSIKVKYVSSGLAICLVSLLLVSAISYLLSYNITAQQSNSRIQETALKNASELDSWFMEYGKIIEGIVEDIEISGNDNQEYLSNLMKGKLAIYNKDVLDFYIGFEDGSRKLISGSEWVPPSDYDCRTRDWYINAKEKKGIAYTEPYVDAQTNEMVITIAEAVRKNGKPICVIAADIYLTNVIKVVSNYNINETSYAFLLDNKGDLLVHPNRSFLSDKNGLKNMDKTGVADYSKLSAAMKNLTSQVKVDDVKDYDGQTKCFILSKIKSSGWVFGISIMQSEYKKPLNNLLYGFIAALVISTIAGVSIMLKLIGGMVKPIKSLNTTVSSFSADNMDVRSSLTSEDEIGELGKSFNKMADTIQEYSISLENKVAERTRELKEKNDSIMESIDYAERLQRSILPPLAQRLSLPEDKCFVVWKPRDIVGGDMYWCRGDGSKVLLAVGDCTGHGVPGALMTMTLSSILDSLSRELGNKNPSEILHLVHLRLKEALEQESKDSLANDGADAALCLIDRPNKKIVFSGAKLSLFVSNDGKITEYKGTKHSVGYSWKKDVSYEDQEIAWIPGSKVYITTDGLLDQNMVEGKGGMGRSGFVQFLESISQKTMTEQYTAVEDMIAQRLEKAEQRDDITVLAFEID